MPKKYLLGYKKLHKILLLIIYIIYIIKIAKIVDLQYFYFLNM
jgi:hypothetical protein